MARSGEAPTSGELITAAREQMAREAATSAALVEAARRHLEGTGPSDSDTDVGSEVGDAPLVGGATPAVETPVSQPPRFQQYVGRPASSGRRPARSPVLQPIPAPPSGGSRATRRVRRLISLAVAVSAVVFIVSTNSEGIGDFVAEQFDRTTEPSGPAVEPAGSSSGDVQDAAGLGGEWHRDNYRRNHELLTCTATDVIVQCSYEQQPASDPDPRTELSDEVEGRFIGAFIDPSDCPVHMNGPCASAVEIAQGTATLTSGIQTEQTLALQGDGSMILSWDTPGFFGSPFHCPWYTSYETALAKPHDCTFFN